MIDPRRITDFNRTDAELEEFALFCPAAAGKSADQQAKKLNEILAGYEEYWDSPFESFRWLVGMGELRDSLEAARLGKYNLLEACYRELVRRDAAWLRTCSAEDLEELPGFGIKTARFFLLHSRPDSGVACIDTHVMKFLRALGHDCPGNLPSTRKKYLECERLFLEAAESYGVPPHVLDLTVWTHFNALAGQEVSMPALTRDIKDAWAVTT